VFSAGLTGTRTAICERVVPVLLSAERADVTLPAFDPVTVCRTEGDE
jgi:hypothetical protein